MRRLPPVVKPAGSPKVERLYWIRAGGERKGNIKQFHILYVDQEKWEKSLVMGDLLRIFEEDVELWLAENSRRRIFMHAGVVGWRGRAILFPGGTMSGKSTLVARLVKAGATYFSDEYAILDPNGMVHPYPRPLGVRTDPEEIPVRVPAHELGGSVGTRPLPVGLVVMSRYQPGGKWRPRGLTPGRAVLAMLRNTMTARMQPRLALSVLPKIAAGVPVLKGVRGEADEVIGAILGRSYWN